MSKRKKQLTGRGVVIAGVLGLGLAIATGQAQETPRPAQPEQPSVEGQVEERGVPQQKAPPFQRPLPSPQPPKGPITPSQKDYVFKTVPSTVHNISKGTNVRIQVSLGYEIFFPEVTSPGKLRVEGLTLDQMVTNFQTTKTFFPASPLEKQCCNLLRLPVGPSPQASKYFVGVGAPLIIRTEPGSDLKIMGPIFIRVLIDQNLTKAFNIPNAEVSLLMRALHIPGSPDLGGYVNPGLWGYLPKPNPCSQAFIAWLYARHPFDTDTLSRKRLLAVLKSLLGFGYNANFSRSELMEWCNTAKDWDKIWTIPAFEHVPDIAGGEYLVPTVLMPGIWTSSLPR